MAKPYPKKGLPPKKKSYSLKRTPLKKGFSKKKQKQIVESKEYYADAIKENKDRFKGTCRCENCGNEILFPTGKNVSHVIGGGANLALYLDPINNFILCFTCEGIWTDARGGSKYDMAIFPASEKRKEELTLKYYTKNKV